MTLEKENLNMIVWMIYFIVINLIIMVVLV
jgi:hypothetical protein